MLTEQGKVIHGWAHKWHAENRKLQKAAKRVNAFRNLDTSEYDGLTVIQKPSGETVITLELTPHEIKAAPKVVKRVFTDIKLQGLSGPPSGNAVTGRPTEGVSSFWDTHSGVI